MPETGQNRSTDALDYQGIQRPVAAMAKEFTKGSIIPAHSHPRGQLLHAVKGIMLARTTEGAWIVPPRHALWIPPRTEHAVEMRASVAMRTVYIGTPEADAIAPICKTIAVSPLLRETILALLEEPVLYREDGRGGALAALIVDEIARAAASPFELPLPYDRRLTGICEALIEKPSLALDIDGWASRAGLSRRTLTRKFREETGLSFATWRQRLRALTAVAQLSEGANSKTAAREAGYRRVSALKPLMSRS